MKKSLLLLLLSSVALQASSSMTHEGSDDVKSIKRSVGGHGDSLPSNSQKNSKKRGRDHASSDKLDSSKDTATNRPRTLRVTKSLWAAYETLQISVPSSYDQTVNAWHALSALQLAAFGPEKGLPTHLLPKGAALECNHFNADAEQITPFTTVAAHLIESLHGPLDDATRAAFEAIQLEAAQHAIPLDHWIKPTDSGFIAHKKQPYYPAMLLFWAVIGTSMQTSENAQWLQDTVSSAYTMEKSRKSKPWSLFLKQLSQDFYIQTLLLYATDLRGELHEDPWIVVRVVQHITPVFTDKCKDVYELAAIIRALNSIVSEADLKEVLGLITKKIMDKCTNGEQLADVIEAFGGLESAAERQVIVDLLSPDVRATCVKGFQLAGVIQGLTLLAPRERTVTKALRLSYVMAKCTDDGQATRVLLALMDIPFEVVRKEVLDALTTKLMDQCADGNQLAGVIKGLSLFASQERTETNALRLATLMGKCNSDNQRLAVINALKRIPSEVARKTTLDSLTTQMLDKCKDGWELVDQIKALVPFDADNAMAKNLRSCLGETESMLSS